MKVFLNWPTVGRLVDRRCFKCQSVHKSKDVQLNSSHDVALTHLYTCIQIPTHTHTHNFENFSKLFLSSAIRCVLGRLSEMYKYTFQVKTHLRLKQVQILLQLIVLQQFDDVTQVQMGKLSQIRAGALV